MLACSSYLLFGLSDPAKVSEACKLALRWSRSFARPRRVKSWPARCLLLLHGHTSCREEGAQDSQRLAGWS